jgi:hypothetical protein
MIEVRLDGMAIIGATSTSVNQRKEIKNVRISAFGKILGA